MRQRDCDPDLRIALQARVLLMDLVGNALSSCPDGARQHLYVWLMDDVRAVTANGRLRDMDGKTWLEFLEADPRDGIEHRFPHITDLLPTWAQDQREGGAK